MAPSRTSDMTDPSAGFEITDAVRGVFKSRLLVYGTVRRMIGGDEIDHSHL